MASEVTLYSKDGSWRVDVEAWKNNFLVYKSIGTEVTVYHRQQTKNIWGNTVTDWVRANASSIFIRNVYKGTGPGSATRQKTCPSSSYCEIKEWAVGVTITIPTDGGDASVGGGAILDIDSVTSSVVVTIGGEHLRAEVSASSIFSDSSIW